MMKSAFVRRQLLLVVAAVIVTLAMTTMVYSIYMRNLLATTKSDDLAATAKRVAQRMESPGWGVSWWTELELGLTLLDARCVIYENGKFPEYMLVSDPSPDKMPPEVMVDSVFRGMSVRLQPSAAWQSGNLIVGHPVVDSNKNVAYAVFLVKGTSELAGSMNSMNDAMIAIVLAAIGFMLFPTCIGAWFLARPIYQMRDVALRMARGDFSARANEKVSGEIGELGATLNYLSDRLSETIGELRLERQRLLSIVNGLGEGILAVGANGGVTHVNPALIRMFGTGREGIEVFEDGGLREDFFKTIQTKEPMVRTMCLSGMILRVTITPLESIEGLSEGAVGLFRDITEQERLEQTRRDYVANVSHELRTPVSSIRGLAEALYDGMIHQEEDRLRYYGLILRESMRLNRLIEDLLELSRLQSGTVALKTQKVDIVELLMDFHEQYKQRAADVGIRFELSLPEECPKARTNPDRIEQVLVILFDNAIKFTGTDGLITISAELQREKMVISVRDTGTGIDPADIGSVFDRFYKADKAHTGQGTGLGLSIAREIINHLGEKISVESNPGHGAAFLFTVSYWEENIENERGGDIMPPPPQTVEAVILEE